MNAGEEQNQKLNQRRMDRHRWPPDDIARVVLNQVQDRGVHYFRQFFVAVIPERSSMDSIDELASAIRLGNLGGDEEVRDAFEEMLIEIGFLAHAIDVGPVRSAVRFGGDSARPKHRSHGTIPVTAVR